MNHITERLNDLGNELAPTGHEAQAAATFACQQLSETIASEHRVPPARRHARRPRQRRRARRLVLPVLFSGCLAVAIMVLNAAVPNRERAHPSIGPGAASAAVVLRRVADRALRAPAAPHPGPHQYLYLKELEGQAVGTPPARKASNGSETPGSMVLESDLKQDWGAPNGSGREIIAATTTRFYTPGDRAIAKRAGVSPPPNISSDGIYPAGGIAYDNPVGLPLQPQELLHAIENRFWRGKFNLNATFYTTAQLLQDSQSPALRAALYRMVADLPGIQVIGSRRDALGRTGTAVGDPVRSDGTRDELIFDPSSSQLLEFASVRVTPSHLKLPKNIPAIPPTPIGAVLNYTAYITSGVVNSRTQLPGGGHEPMHPGITR